MKPTDSSGLLVCVCVCVCVWGTTASQVERKGARGLQQGAPIDTADEGVHCIVKSPPPHQLHDKRQPRSCSKSLSLKVIHLLSLLIREGPQPSQTAMNLSYKPIFTGRGVCKVSVRPWAQIQTQIGDKDDLGCSCRAFKACKTSPQVAWWTNTGIFVQHTLTATTELRNSAWIALPKPRCPTNVRCKRMETLLPVNVSEPKVFKMNFSDLWWRPVFVLFSLRLCLAAPAPVSTRLLFERRSPNPPHRWIKKYKEERKGADAGSQTVTMIKEVLPGCGGDEAPLCRCGVTPRLEAGAHLLFLDQLRCSDAVQ